MVSNFLSIAPRSTAASTTLSSFMPEVGVNRQSLLMVVINHGLNQRALSLKRQFQNYLPTIALDSGSVLSAEQRTQFDLCLPNVYYTGCLRAASEYAMKEGYSHVWIWASDVDCSEPAKAVRLCRETFAHTPADVYAPSADYSFHPQMAPRPGLGLKRVTFTDGFCFAARSELIARACDDFKGCVYGFGVDIQLGMLARKRHRHVYVDHRYQVDHPQGAGYSVRKATDEWHAWRRRQSVQTWLFHRLARKRFSRTPVGMKLLLSLPW